MKPGSSLFRDTRWLVAMGISGVAVLAALCPLLTSGFGRGHDWPLELIRIAEYRHALMEGQQPPFWASNLYHGYGSPIFLFYAPLYLAIAAALVAGGVGVTAAATAALCLFSVVGAFLIWRFIRNLRPESPAAAAVAVTLFSLHPYLLADKWIRNANAEFAALSLLPGVLIGATLPEPRRAFWWTAGSLTLVILAHNITALIAITLAIGIGLFVHRNLRGVTPILGGVSVALAITAFFWVPAFVLQPLIRTEDLLIGKFDFHVQFPAFTALFWPTEFFSAGWLAPILLLLMLFARIADSRERRILRALSIGSLVCLLLMCKASTPIWETLPLLRYVQFPWRLLGPMAVLLAAGGGLVFAGVLPARRQGLVQIVILGVALANAYPAFHRYRPLGPEFAEQTDASSFTVNAIRSQDLRATANYEYLPRGADLREVKPVEGVRLFKQWAFPVWSARTSGREVRVETGPGGVVAIPVNSESEEVALSLREPRARSVWKMVSAAATVLLLVGAVAANARRT